MADGTKIGIYAAVASAASSSPRRSIPQKPSVSHPARVAAAHTPRPAAGGSVPPPLPAIHAPDQLAQHGGPPPPRFIYSCISHSCCSAASALSSCRVASRCRRSQPLSLSEKGRATTPASTLRTARRRSASLGGARCSGNPTGSRSSSSAIFIAAMSVFTPAIPVFKPFTSALTSAITVFKPFTSALTSAISAFTVADETSACEVSCTRVAHWLVTTKAKPTEVDTASASFRVMGRARLQAASLSSVKRRIDGFIMRTDVRGEEPGLTRVAHRGGLLRLVGLEGAGGHLLGLHIDGNITMYHGNTGAEVVSLQLEPAGYANQTAPQLLFDAAHSHLFVSVARTATVHAVEIKMAQPASAATGGATVGTAGAVELRVVRSVVVGAWYAGSHGHAWRGAAPLQPLQLDSAKDARMAQCRQQPTTVVNCWR
ncbi:hypothetical protein CHLRE_07g352075v5 [Chlamydomonas reinhardtii]|uniref:Uncharacterized protein n=1 Tax=Chlamydomonas reinhardtii TaxID=3055 RepID=A0A2K3DLC7_CHLRE|nr:uncharacterized protein CHLRE_07g352075v5 [Chlamydomonas reinhardtii]PNW81344.1 hypothetical protein CHLRE_07g352075v5 [Chlamydomonas reinhardtii]